MVIYVTFPKIYTQIFSGLLDIFCFFLLQVTFQLLLVIILQLKKSYPITIFSPMSQLVFCALKCVKIKNTKTHLKFESGRPIEKALTPNHFWSSTDPIWRRLSCAPKQEVLLLCQPVGGRKNFFPPSNKPRQWICHSSTNKKLSELLSSFNELSFLSCFDNFLIPFSIKAF